MRESRATLAYRRRVDQSALRREGVAAVRLRRMALRARKSVHSLPIAGSHACRMPVVGMEWKYHCVMWILRTRVGEVGVLS